MAGPWDAFQSSDGYDPETGRTHLTVRPDFKAPEFSINQVRGAVSGAQPDRPENWETPIQRQRATGVSPILTAVARRASEIAPFPFVIGDMGGTRDTDTQAKLVAAGKSRTMNSSHLGGSAMDLVPIIDGRASPNASPEQYQAMAGAMKQAAAEMGVPLDWGGDWNGAWDKPHFGLKRPQFDAQPQAVAAAPQERPPPFGIPYNRLHAAGTAMAQAREAPEPQAPQAQQAGPWDAFKTTPDIGRGTAFLTGMEQGVNANFADEKRGVQAAAGTPKELQNPFSGPSDFVSGLAKLGYEYLTGGDEAAKRYAAGRDEFRQRTKSAEQQYPGTTIAGNVAGAIALPGGAAIRGATMPARMAQGAAVGAGYGGLAGAGEGTTVEDRASRAAMGTALGGVVGGAGVPIVEGAVAGARAATALPASYIAAAFNPRAAAERAVGRAYRAATESDPQAVNRLRPQELRPGEPQTVLDTLGAPGQDLARSAANLSPQGRAELNRTLNDRFETQSSRITGWLRQAAHYPDAHAQQKAIEQTAKTVNDPAYGRARAQGLSGIWDQELSDLAQAPAMQDAIKGAIVQAKNRSAPDVSKGAQQLTARWVSKDGKPTLELWDLTKRQLDQEINVAARAGRKSDVEELTAIKNKLLEKLDAAVPSYAEARQGAASFFGAENALEAGQKFVTDKNLAIPRARTALAKMSPTERQLFQDGFVSRYLEVLDQIPDRADIVRKIYNTPDAQQKFQMILGKQKSDELEAILRVENIMMQSMRAVEGNSSTARQLIQQGLAGGGAGAIGGNYLGLDPTTAGIATALTTAGKRGIDIKVATQLARMLTSNDPAVLNRGVRMIARSQSLMGALRSADSAAARVGGGQAQAVPSPMTQLPAPGRAEDQPEIPRPPGQ